MTITEGRAAQGGSFGESGAEPESARSAINEMVDAGLFDDLMSRIDHGTLQLTGEGGFLPEMIKAVLERGLQAEMAGHLGYQKGERSPASPGNSRNGSTPKTVSSEIGEIALSTPRDRDGSFQPALVPKGSRRIGGLDEMIISLYAGGMTVRDIQHHLARTLGTDLSHETIANITDAVLEEVHEWQNRPLEEIYPIMYLDALVVKVLDGHHVMNRSAYIAVGVDLEGVKHVLGIWVQASEGAKFWAGVCAELANRGVKDVLIVCCDGLTGFPEAIEATWPQSTVQTCVVHLIRAAMRFVTYGDRKKVAAAMRPIYTAPTSDAALMELTAFSDSVLGHKYPAAVKVWERSWERFIPFLAFPEAVRRIIYTTNAIESLNYQLRKVTKARGHFPSDDAVVKLLWLAIINIEDKRARERAARRQATGKRSDQPARLVEGQRTMGWREALNELDTAYPGRLR
jgi:putative transposase